MNDAQRAVEELMVHEATVQRRLDASGAGDSYGDPEPLKCQINDQSRQVRGSNGDPLATSATLVYSADLDPIPLGSIVTLPADWNELTGAVVGSQTNIQGPEFPNHRVVYLG